MYMNLCPWRAGVNVSGLDDLAAVAARHGFAGLELPAAAAEPSAQEHTRDVMQAHGLRWGMFPVSCSLCAAPDAYRQGLAALKRVAERAVALGCTRTYDHVWPGHNEMDYRTNFRFHVDRLKPMADILGPIGGRFGIEFIGAQTLRKTFKHEFIHRLDQALELADAVDPSGRCVGVVLDCFHWYCSGGTLEDLRGLLTNQRIVGVHANDAPAGVPVERQLDLQRALPGETGVIDLAGLAGVLRELRYDGPVTAEPFQPRQKQLSQMPPDEAAAMVHASLAKTFSGAGQ